MSATRRPKSITLKEILEVLDVRKPSTVTAGSTLISTIAKLREREFEDVIVLESSGAVRERGGRNDPLVISGYSIISKLLESQPSNYARLLDSSCVDTALAVGTVSDESDLLSLLHVYESTTFGVALIHDSDGEIVGKLSVKELCKLYQRDVLSADLVADEVASFPVFALQKQTELIQTLKEMENRKFRRVQVSGSQLIVSDKQILSHIFEERRLGIMLKTPESLLEGTLEDIKSIPSSVIDGKSKIRDAARLLADENHDCLSTAHGIVTPWDLIIKPWRQGALRVSEKIS